MALTTISARIDTNDKNEFDEFCDSVGITTSTAINIFVKKVLAEQRIPFDVGSSYKKELRQAIKEAEELSKKQDRKTYDSFDEMMVAINKDD